MGVTVSDKEIQERLKEIKKQYFNNTTRRTRSSSRIRA